MVNCIRFGNRLSSGSYFPPAVREASITKKDGSPRPLGIPTVGDRVAQQVLKHYLEPRLEQQFHPNSYGYRPLKSAHQALEAVRKNVRFYDWVIDMDISKFFDTMSHDLLIKGLERHVEEGWIKMYIKRWLEAPSEDAEGKHTARQGRGTPQGGVISPLLANLFLHYTIDLWLERQYPQLSFVRYADDIVIHCESEQQANDVLASVRKRLVDCQLSLNEKKTRLVYCKDYRRKKKDYKVKFDFLGYSFQPRPFKSKDGSMTLGYDCAISIDSEKRINEKIRSAHIPKWTGARIESIAAEFDPKLIGWINYFGKYKKYRLKRVFKNFHFHLMKWVLNRYKRFKNSRKKAYDWLRELRDQNPKLFYHWKVGFTFI